ISVSVSMPAPSPPEQNGIPLPPEQERHPAPPRPGSRVNDAGSGGRRRGEQRTARVGGVVAAGVRVSTRGSAGEGGEGEGARAVGGGPDAPRPPPTASAPRAAPAVPATDHGEATLRGGPSA